MRALFTLLCLGIVSPLSAQQADADGYIGSEMCQACHPDVAQGFNRNPHFKSLASGKLVPAKTGCEGCHGPGKEHFDGKGDVTKIIRFPELAANEVIDRCLSCHANDLGKMEVRRSSHTTAEVSCVSCHKIHQAPELGPLLQATERETCYTCHAEIRGRFNLPFKHRVNEGAIRCSDCHNPHGTQQATWGGSPSSAMVRHAFGNDVACVGCHTDKRGPFVYEHEPVRVEGCMTCHNPHGSTNARLLNRPAVFTMCLECHNDVIGFGPREAGIPNPGANFHNLREPRFQNCVTCHSRIHGSNADSLFRR